MCYITALSLNYKNTCCSKGPYSHTGTEHKFMGNIKHICISAEVSLCTDVSGLLDRSIAITISLCFSSSGYFLASSLKWRLDVYLLCKTTMNSYDCVLSKMELFSSINLQSKPHCSSPWCPAEYSATTFFSLFSCY